MKEKINFKNVKNRKDFLSIDDKTAISSYGDVFNIGDEVSHKGDISNKKVKILRFEINKVTQDIIAHYKEGASTISLLYFKK